MRHSQPEYSYIDCHTHILPGVDDGSKDMEMTRAMLQVAAENNIESMILTPHNKVFMHSVSPESQERRIAQLQQESDAAGYHIRFYPGNECYYDETLIERLRAGKVRALADSDYILVEFHPMDEYRRILDGLRSLYYAGYEVVLAHVERYSQVVEHPERARELTRSGIHLQVNAASVVPHLLHDNRIPHFVRGLLDDGRVSLIGTDAHRPEGRAPLMNACAAYLTRHYDEDYVRLLLHDNAEHIIRNEDME